MYYCSKCSSPITELINIQKGLYSWETGKLLYFAKRRCPHKKHFWDGHTSFDVTKWGEDGRWQGSPAVEI